MRAETTRRPGRQAPDGATNVKRVTLCLEPEDHAKLERLSRAGGSNSAWVRQAIRTAPEPGSNDQQTDDAGRLTT